MLMVFFYTKQPQNRDRLELYAWHKQAVSGDAPASLLASSNTNTNSNLTAAETAKITAWRAKRGADSATAMRQYLQEAERQIRVYGASPNNNSGMPSLLEQESTSNNTSARSTAASASSSSSSSRGLAALPLLCAAAAEPRASYLRRVQTTPPSSAWWRRQEPLVATPGRLAAWPEHALLAVAAALETISLAVNNNTTNDNNNNTGSSSGGAGTSATTTPSAFSAVVQSFFWPLHNALLAVWMGWIVVCAMYMAANDLTQTLLLGSRRTGRTLSHTWQDDVVFAAQSVRALTDAHQPLTARVVGLVLLPLPISVNFIQTVAPSDQHHLVGRTALYVAFVAASVWYWLGVVPWFLIVGMLGSAALLGNCFAVIEWAAHI